MASSNVAAFDNAEYFLDIYYTYALPVETEWDSAKARFHLAWRRLPIGETGFASSRHVAPLNQNRKSMEKEYDFSKGKRGPVISNKGKTCITIYVDDEILDVYRCKADEIGRGYQTLINETLTQSISTRSVAVDAKTLRRILREELKKAG